MKGTSLSSFLGLDKTKQNVSLKKSKKGNRFFLQQNKTLSKADFD